MDGWMASIHPSIRKIKIDPSAIRMGHPGQAKISLLEIFLNQLTTEVANFSLKNLKKIKKNSKNLKNIWKILKNFEKFWKILKIQKNLNKFEKFEIFEK